MFISLHELILQQRHQLQNYSHNSTTATMGMCIGFIYAFVNIGQKLFVILFIYLQFSEDELIPVIGDLHLPEHYFAKQQADCGISEVFVD